MPNNVNKPQLSGFWFRELNPRVHARRFLRKGYELPFKDDEPPPSCLPNNLPALKRFNEDIRCNCFEESNLCGLQPDLPLCTVEKEDGPAGLLSQRLPDPLVQLPDQDR